MKKKEQASSTANPNTRKDSNDHHKSTSTSAFPRSPETSLIESLQTERDALIDELEETREELYAIRQRQQQHQHEQHEQHHKSISSNGRMRDDDADDEYDDSTSNAKTNNSNSKNTSSTNTINPLRATVEKQARQLMEAREVMAAARQELEDAHQYADELEAQLEQAALGEGRINDSDDENVEQGHQGQQRQEQQQQQQQMDLLEEEKEEWRNRYEQSQEEVVRLGADLEEQRQKYQALHEEQQQRPPLQKDEEKQNKIQTLLKVNSQLRTTAKSLREQIKQRDDQLKDSQQKIQNQLANQKMEDAMWQRQVHEWEQRYHNLSQQHQQQQEQEKARARSHHYASSRIRHDASFSSIASSSDVSVGRRQREQQQQQQQRLWVQKAQDLQAENDILQRQQQQQAKAWEHQKNMFRREIEDLTDRLFEFQQQEEKEDQIQAEAFINGSQDNNNWDEDEDCFVDAIEPKSMMGRRRSSMGLTNHRSSHYSNGTTITSNSYISSTAAAAATAHNEKQKELEEEIAQLRRQLFDETQEKEDAQSRAELLQTYLDLDATPASTKAPKEIQQQQGSAKSTSQSKQSLNSNLNASASLKNLDSSTLLEEEENQIMTKSRSSIDSSMSQKHQQEMLDKLTQNHQTEISEFQRKYNLMETRCTELLKDNSNLLEKMNQVSLSDEQYSILQNERDDLQRQLQMKEERLAELEEQISSLNTVNENLKMEFDESRQAQETLQKTIDSRDMDVSAHKARILSLEKNLKEQQKTIENLESQHEEVSNTVQDKSFELDDSLEIQTMLRQELAKVREKMNGLVAEKETLVADKSELKKIIEASTTTEQEMKTLIDTLKEENSKLVDQLEDQQDENEDDAKELASLEKQIDEADILQVDLMGKLATAEEELETLRLREKELEEEVFELENENLRLTSQIQGMFDHTSISKSPGFTSAIQTPSSVATSTPDSPLFEDGTTLDGPDLDQSHFGSEPNSSLLHDDASRVEVEEWMLPTLDGGLVGGEGTQNGNHIPANDNHSDSDSSSDSEKDCTSANVDATKVLDALLDNNDNPKEPHSVLKLTASESADSSESKSSVTRKAPKYSLDFFKQGEPSSDDDDGSSSSSSSSSESRGKIMIQQPKFNAAFFTQNDESGSSSDSSTSSSSATSSSSSSVTATSFTSWVAPLDLELSEELESRVEELASEPLKSNDRMLKLPPGLVKGSTASVDGSDDGSIETRSSFEEQSFDWESEARALRLELKNLKQTLEGLDKASIHQENLNGTEETAVASLQDSQKVEDELNLSRNRISALEEEKKRLSIALEEAASDADKQRWQHEDSLVALRAEVDETREKIDKLTKELTTSKGDSEQTKRVNATLIEELNEANRQLRDLQASRELASTEAADNTRIKIELQEALNKLNEMNASEAKLKGDLDAAIADADEVHWRHEDALVSLRTELSEVRDALDHSTKDFDQATQNLQLANQAKTDVLAELMVERSKVENLTVKLAETKAAAEISEQDNQLQITKLNAELNSQLQRVEMLHNQKSDLERDLESERKEKIDLQSSRSLESKEKAAESVTLLQNHRLEIERLTEELSNANKAFESSKQLEMDLVEELSNAKNKIVELEGILKEKADASDLSELELNRLQSKLQETSDKESKLAAELDATKKEVDAQNLENRNAISKIRDEIEKQKEEVKSLQERLEESNRIKSDLTNDLEVANQRMKEMESTLSSNEASLAAEIAILHNEIAAKKAELEKTIKSKEELQQEMNAMAERADIVQKELEDCQVQLRDVSDRETTLKDELDKALSEADEQRWRHEDALSTVRADLDSSRDQVASITKDLEAARGEVSNLQHLKGNLLDDLDAAQSRIDEIMKSKNDLDQENEASSKAVHTELEATKLEAKAASEKENELRKSLDESRNKIEELTMDLQKSKLMLQETEDACTHAQDELEVANEVCLELQEALDSKEDIHQKAIEELKSESDKRFDNACAQLNDLEDQVLKLEEEKSRLKAQIKAQEEQIERALSQFNDMETSLISRQDDVDAADLRAKAFESQLVALQEEVFSDKENFAEKEHILKNEIELLTKERDKWRDKADKQQYLVDEFSQKANKQKSVNADLSDRIEVLETTIDLLETSRDGLEEEIDSIGRLGSSSMDMDEFLSTSTHHQAERTGE